jgi:O-antigen ligase
MVFVVGAAMLATLLELANSKWRFKDAPQNWLVLGFFIAVVVSNAFSFAQPMNLTSTLNAFREFWKIALLYYLISINLTTPKRVRGFVLAIIVGCVFMSVHGILQIYTGSGFGGQLPLDMMALEGTMRIQAFGFFQDPNDLALALVVAMPFVFSGIHRRGASAPARLINFGVAAVLGYGIFLTNSRGGWLALAVTMMSYVLLNFRLKKVAVVAGILLMTALMMLAPGRVSSSSMNGRDESARGRLSAWADGNRMLKQSPIFGVGKNRYAEYSESGKVAHNSYVHCYAELGLFGYFFWLGLLYASLKDGRALGKIAPSDSDPEPAEIARLSKVLLTALIGYLASALFLSRTYTPLLFILLGMFAALRMMRQRAAGPLPNAFTRRDCKWVLLLELASIPFFYVMIRFMWHGGGSS